MGRLRLIAAVAIAASALSLDWGSAACAAPEVELDPSAASPGDTIVVSGSGWNDVCDDTGGDEGGGCWDDGDDDEGRPTQNIDIDIKRLGQPGAAWNRLVDDVDADDRFRIRAEIRVPDLPSGAYALRVVGGYPKLRLFIPPEGS
jgi:hypothetical protein